MVDFSHCCAAEIKLGGCIGIKIFHIPTVFHLLVHSYCAMRIAFGISYLSLHLSCDFFPSSVVQMQESDLRSSLFAITRLLAAVQRRYVWGKVIFRTQIL